MLRLPTNRDKRIKITNLSSQKFILKHDITHFLHYFWGASLFGSEEPLKYGDVKDNQVFKFKGETYLIEIITKSDASDLVY